MKKIITMLLVFAMIACMVPAFTLASSADAADAITLDGDLSDWEGIKTVSVVGSGDYEGKSATWYGKLTDEGLYLACDAYHSIFKTDAGEWHTNTNFEFFLRYPNQQQGWVSAKGINGTTPTEKNRITSSIMVTEAITEHGAATQHTVTEVFISNDIMGNMVYADAIRVGLAWKTPGDDINNNGTGNSGIDNWWCVANPNGDTKSVVTANGVYTKAEYEALGIEGNTILTAWDSLLPAEATVNTADEYLEYVKLANYVSGCNGSATKGKTLTIGADIDFTGKTWAPLNRWIGTLEGNGKTLSGITYETTRTGATGLIVNDNANDNANGTVQNLTVADSTLSAPSANEVGAIAGKSDRGRIKSCTVDNCLIVGSTNVGAVAGRVCWPSDGDYTLAQDCTVTDTTVVATAENGVAGGLIGVVSDTKAQLGTYTLDGVTVIAMNPSEIVSAGTVEATENSSTTDVTLTQDNKVPEPEEPEQPENPDTPAETGDIALLLIVAAVLSVGVAVVVTKRRQSVR